MKPLAERLRPADLKYFIGQEHLVGKNGVFYQLIQSGKISSMILWGPPGVGKTTLARIIGQQLKRPFYTLSAVSAGVKEVREIIQQAKDVEGAILFIDEIHRFSKSQQDALLGAVEEGIVTLIGATTENPSFEVISPLLSRCQVYLLKSLEKEDLLGLLGYALKEDEYLRQKNIELKETEALLRFSGGDARKLLNLLELVVNAEDQAKLIQITDEQVMQILQNRMALYDKSGEQHYDIISAFIKSMRGSDPNAAVYWLARMIEGGEDPLFIARRLVILASEDIGNANPNALLLATSCFQAVSMIGMPEGRIILSQTCIYLACSAKSNASYAAVESALQKVKEKGDLAVPLHIRNAPTYLMKKLGYGKDYAYAHDYEGNFIAQEYLPKELSGTKFYDPGKNTREKEFGQHLRNLWQKKYGY